MKKQLHAVLKTLSDGVLITLAVLAAPCTVLTAYSVPYPLVALIIAAIGIGLCLSVWMHAHPFSLAAGVSKRAAALKPQSIKCLPQS